jgi:hypothetical protein
MLIRSDFVKVKVFVKLTKTLALTKTGSVTAFLVGYLEFGASRKDFVKFSSKWGGSAAEPLYCIRLRRSKPDGKDVVKTKHYYVCDRHGEYIPRGFGVRSTASIATMISYSGLGRGSALEIAAIQVGDISRNGGSAGRGIRERGRPSLAVRSKQSLIASV